MNHGLKLCISGVLPRKVPPGGGLRLPLGVAHRRQRHPPALPLRLGPLLLLEMEERESSKRGLSAAEDCFR